MFTRSLFPPPQCGTMRLLFNIPRKGLDHPMTLSRHHLLTSYAPSGLSCLFVNCDADVETESRTRRTASNLIFNRTLSQAASVSETHCIFVVPPQWDPTTSFDLVNFAAQSLAYADTMAEM